jgi:uncharacterized protein
MDKRTIEAYIAEFKERKLPKLVERSLEVKITKDTIISIIGPRRAGKTYYFYQLISRFGKEDSLYLNFEDPELSDVSYKDIKGVLEVYREIFGKYPKYLFFDEIQNISNWDKPIRSLYELKRFYIFVTGSSSKLLSKEIASSLRGRTLSYVLLPFSFKKFLNIRKVEVTRPLSFSKESSIKNLLRKYAAEGGFPQIVLNPEREFQERFVGEYLDLVMYRDVIERHNIKNLHVIKFMIRSLLASFSKEFSIHGFFRTLKSQNIKVSKKTVYNYFAYFEDAFLVSPVNKFSFSVKESFTSPPKIYLADTSLSLSRYPDERGRKIENIVALELMRRRSYFYPLMELFYYKSVDRKEVDFVIKDASGINQLVQVCYDVSDLNTKRRETRALLKASRDLKCNNLLVITWDYEAEEEFKGEKIKFVPLWKWLLNY